MRSAMVEGGDETVNKLADAEPEKKKKKKTITISETQRYAEGSDRSTNTWEHGMLENQKRGK